MNERDVNLLLNIKDEAEILLKMTEGYDLHDFLTNAFTFLFSNSLQTNSKQLSW